MEKIYMEDDYKKDKSYRRLFNFSIVLSFTVAIFAVFSIAAAGVVSIQGNGVSYAAPTSDTFTLKHGDAVFAYDDEDRISVYKVPTYYANSVSLANQIFCVERGKDTEELNYTKTDSARSGVSDIKADSGLLYLLSLSQTTAGRNVTSHGDAINGFVIQSAIWLYLSEKYTDDVYKFRKNMVSPSNVDDLAVLESPVAYIAIGDAAGQLTAYTDLTGPNGVIRKLVNQAKAATIPQISVTKDDSEIAKTDDGAFYQSPLITVSANPASSLVSYDVSLDGIDGGVLVDEDGNDLNLENIEAGKAFYVRIPADKVSDSVQTLRVSVKGHFEGLNGVYYESSDANLQRLMTVTPGTVNDGVEIEFVGAPDTGMNTAQTVYFIGLIVLLCGIGIVYANAKPVEAK